MSLLVSWLSLLNLGFVRDVRAQHTSSPRVQLGETVVVGTTGPDTVEFFGGLPFAQPPVGNLRFRSPVPVATLTGRRTPAPLLSEDCLNLNIFRPAGTKPGAKLPVMVWIYVGAAASYNGSTLVAHSAVRGTPIIYVNFNYRLASLGFPTGFEAGAKKALNLGLRDQIAALEFIQENIGFFGGDKTKVTLFGESAGAIAIADLFLNSNLEKYIHGAIFESGTMGTNRLLLPSDGQVLWTSFLSMIPACANTSTTFDSFECLRNVPVDDIVTAEAVAVATTVVGWTPVIDGIGGFIPELPSKLMAEGHFSRIPFISGTNLDEGTLFVDPSLTTTDDLHFYIASQLPGISDPAQMNATIEQMMKLYPDDPALGSPFDTGNETFGLSPEWKRGAAISCDVNFAGVCRGWTQAASKFGVKTFAYLFTDPQFDSGYLGIPHSSEVSPIMMDYWISFASTLDPNDGKGTERAKWEQYTLSHQALVQLHADSVTMIPDAFRVAPIAFINNHAPYFGH
ncbi:esterase 1 [Mycena haematopus]|nr:esterase 1 [Mycena haematopus]